MNFLLENRNLIIFFSFCIFLSILCISLCFLYYYKKYNKKNHQEIISYEPAEEGNNQNSKYNPIPEELFKKGIEAFDGCIKACREVKRANNEVIKANNIMYDNREKMYDHMDENINKMQSNLSSLDRLEEKKNEEIDLEK